MPRRRHSAFIRPCAEITLNTVELRKISKTFSGVSALSNVDLTASAGECLGLLGENGAGKSTLMKILSGVWDRTSFSGELLIEGRAQNFSGPKDAAEAGISIIHQELSLFEELSVAENIFTSQCPTQFGVVRRRELIRKSEDILDQLQFQISPWEKVKDLSVGERQLVEIARAFTKPVKVLIFDEPTSALTDREIDRLFQIIKNFKSKGVCCLYISHKLPEIHELCDRVTVLRDGASVASFDQTPFQDEALIEAMVGRKIDSVFPVKRAYQPSRKTLLEVRNLSFKHAQTGKALLSNISFEVKQGEILGIAGLMGSRRTELLLSLFGALRAEKISGELFLEGKKLQIETPRDAIQMGLGLVTEDRKASGLVLELGVKDNLTLPILRKISKFLTVRPVEEHRLVQHYCDLLRVKTPDQNFKVRYLSGGNQQKVILSRWLSTQPKLLLLDEPTRGIDVLAKSEIYALIRKLVDNGLTLVLVSSELPEVVSLADRVLVMREGKVAGILEGSEISQHHIMERAAA